MDFQRFYAVAIAASSLACQTASLRAQTTRIRQDPGGTIKSLTNLNHPRQDSASFGRVDAGASDTVDASVPGMNLESANDNLATRSGSRRVGLQGLPASARFSQSRDSQNLTGSRAYTQPSLRTPATVSSFLPTLPHASLHVSQQTAKRTPIHSTWGLRSGRIKTFTNDVNTTSAQPAQIPFERLTDPFSGPLNGNFEGPDKKIDVEQPCGDACSLRFPGRFGLSGSEAPPRGSSVHSAKLGIRIRLRPSMAQLER
jgi:hypothetical protein